MGIEGSTVIEMYSLKTLRPNGHIKSFSSAPNQKDKVIVNLKDDEQHKGSLIYVDPPNNFISSPWNNMFAPKKYASARLPFHEDFSNDFQAISQMRNQKLSKQHRGSLIQVGPPNKFRPRCETTHLTRGNMPTPDSPSMKTFRNASKLSFKWEIRNCPSNT